MTITIKTENQELFDNLLWLLEHFKDDGLEISTSKMQRTKPISLKTKDFKFDREEANQRETKWEKFSDRMSGLTTPEITEYIQKKSQEMRGKVRKKLPNGFTEPIEVDSYDEDASMISVGLVYRFGKTQNKVLHNLANDKDSDGVSNTNDQCPGTEAGRSVNEIGCEFDGDGDGIKDSLDLCPQTPAGLIVFAQAANVVGLGFSLLGQTASMSVSTGGPCCIFSLTS